MDKKYELTDETIECEGKTLHRIRAVKDFGEVKKGELGGYVESEENLSQYGNSWIYDIAKVYEDAFVCEDAFVWVGGKVYGNARVGGGARVGGNVMVYGNAMVGNKAMVYGDTLIYGNAIVGGNASVGGNAMVYGNVMVYGSATVHRNARIEKRYHIIAIENMGSRNSTTTFYRNKDNGISVDCGCFNGTIEEFEEAVHKTHKDTKHFDTYTKAIELAKLQIELD